MAIEVDEKFKKSGQVWKQRKRRRLIKRLASVALALTTVAFVGWTFIPDDSPQHDTSDHQAELEEGDASGDDDVGFVQSEATSQATIILAAASEVFLDIRGAPMILHIQDGAASTERMLMADKELDPFRAPAGSRLISIEDKLLDAGQTVQLTIPSSSADLAAFQNRRSTAFNQPAAQSTNTAQTEEVSAGQQVQFDDGDGSWGSLVGGKDGTALQSVAYVDTVIKDTTMQRAALASKRRNRLFDDSITRLKKEQTLKDVLVKASLSEEEAERAVSKLLRRMEENGTDTAGIENLAVGSLVALRRTPSRLEATLLQLSIYNSERYLVTLVQTGPGRFELGADPWFSENLLVKAIVVARSSAGQKEVRLKDALYSAALRHGLPTELVGELMVMLARNTNLDDFARDTDRFHVLYSSDETLLPAARLLYAKLTSGKKTSLCYVVRNTSNEGTFECYDPNQKAASSSSTSAFGNGFVIPVNGTKTSSFGPRFHPILKKHVNHNGVDWGAPTGTPVHAATGGKISRANVSSSYGNIIYINHPGGMQSRYAHLDKFAVGISLGVTVKAGQLIGYVGTTGRSTGPHLHFEFHVGGKPVDPLAMRSTASTGAASGAVEILVNRIIQVESAGNARAKNTRSTATGLGQFIESTWLRMMKTYRPDLSKTLGRQEQLDLRFDPTMSRQMVTNLARENEAFLRARGHATSPGRLYLAHFLGPAGANIALKADPQESVLSTMGSGVVNANPFLKGWTVQKMTDWSDRKMSNGRGVSKITNAAPVARVVSQAVKDYRAAIDFLIKAL
jgi:murein DD-endopeptidase MepM/ murein hydrolase activator NlpD